MSVLVYSYVAVATRLRRLTAAEHRDRGESPVPTAIIIAGLAVLAVGLIFWADDLARQFMDTAPAPGDAP